ncbi:MAG: endonuclease Q family protein [Nibricoccus sp.]
MKLAVDLHLHSHHAGGVSPEMTLPNLIMTAQQKGMDVLATGDCLQADWLKEIEIHLYEIGSGFLQPRTETYDLSRETLPLHLHRPVRFVLSTEVCCAPRGTKRLHGLHHLLYFRSIESVRRFREKLRGHGDLKDGRPTLNLTSRRLLEMVREHGDGCELVPAHVLSPWYSSLGSTSGEKTLEAVFGDNARNLLAVEVGVPATPKMCRRISALDQHTLICSSDAHSLENVGREYTLLDIEPNYDALTSALRDRTGCKLVGFVKFPVARTGYYYRFCGVCQKSQPGTVCPTCGLPLPNGTYHRTEEIADRPEPLTGPRTPPYTELLPLDHLLSLSLGFGQKTDRVSTTYERHLHAIGHQRYILTEAPLEELRNATTYELAQIIVAQRNGAPPFGPPEQLALGF